MITTVLEWQSRMILIIMDLSEERVAILGIGIMIIAIIITTVLEVVFESSIPLCVVGGIILYLGLMISCSGTVISIIIAPTICVLAVVMIMIAGTNSVRS